MMRVMALVKATNDSEKGFPPTPEMVESMEAMGKFNDRASQCRHPARRRRRQALLAGQAYCVR